MELINEFRVGVPVEQAWSVLTDVERIAPCLPGAQLQEVDGDEYRGVVKVKVGPITAQYKGAASFVEQDAVAWRAVLKAEGRETRGQGNASATITATLVPDGASTAVTTVTDLKITGKVAQFGRGVLAEVSAKLLDQFVENLERDVLSGSASVVDEVAVKSGVAEPAPAGAAGPSPAGAAGPSPAGSVRRVDAPPAQPVDLVQAAGSSLARRLIPALATMVVGILYLRRRRRGRPSRS
jgi:carbon monoxide dehydrogenase subunit G